MRSNRFWDITSSQRLGRNAPYSPVFGDGARMALTPNLRKVGSLLLDTDIFGEHDSRVSAVAAIGRSAGAPLKDKVVVAVGREAHAEGTVRLM